MNGDALRVATEGRSNADALAHSRTKRTARMHAMLRRSLARRGSGSLNALSSGVLMLRELDDGRGSLRASSMHSQQVRIRR
eukprot:CAMPEP_0195616632 /NCGR_PEP_ID=MMETSP0815-20121206/13124_1 /TAXON_ID=97485 /ORGANISM="Prymnesium parvum, Strain Texoma1" /LENGTH=80 /DNA_ID=CAMNT_0040757057 /DNA_START=440 /DNA_END=679 /DNA_ORIENTATION=+